MGLCTIIDFLVIFDAGTASSNSKALTRVNNNAFILLYRSQREVYVESAESDRDLLDQ